MSLRWLTVPMGDEVKFRSGGTPSKSEAKYWDGEIPWVSSGEMTQRRIYDTELHVTEEGAENGTRLVPENTVLVVVRGMSLAKEFRISLTGRPVTFNQDLKALQPSAKVDSGFLFYYLQSQSHAIRDSATDASHGTKKLESRVLETWPLPVPDLPEQYAIRDILSAYDDLIENNRRRIQLLEQAARLLYKEWLVHLRFPGHEHVEIKDGVPEGWESSTIGNASSFISRGITPTYDEDALGTVINQKCIRDQRVTMDLARRQSKEVPPSKLVRYGDVLVNSTGQGTLGRVAQFLDAIENCTVDSHVTITRPDEDVPVFLYGHHIASNEEYLASMGRGATNQTELSKDVVAELSFLRPPHLLAEQFELFAKDNADQVRNLTQQNTALAKARDLLLPRLMNGGLTA